MRGSGAADQRPAVRKLLADPDAGVRLRVALSLFDAHDKDAVPVLIALLTELPRDQVWRAEDPLYQAADDKAPAGSLGTDEVARRDYRKQWDKWWQDNGNALDLAKLQQQHHQQGLTVIAQMDLAKAGAGRASGRVYEVDNDGKVKWQIEGLLYPVDVQILGDDRVLIAEYTGRQVTERNLKGEVQWTKAVNGLLLVLPGGWPTATRSSSSANSLMEVDKEGKEVVTIPRPSNDIVAAVRDAHRRHRRGDERWQFHPPQPGRQGVEDLSGRAVVHHWRRHRRAAQRPRAGAALQHQQGGGIRPGGQAGLGGDGDATDLRGPAAQRQRASLQPQRAGRRRARPHG